MNPHDRYREIADGRVPLSNAYDTGAMEVVATLNAENRQLLAENSEMESLVVTLTSHVAALTAANADLNAELTSLRRSLMDERDREGCE